MTASIHHCKQSSHPETPSTQAPEQDRFYATVLPLYHQARAASTILAMVQNLIKPPDVAIRPEHLVYDEIWPEHSYRQQLAGLLQKVKVLAAELADEIHTVGPALFAGIPPKYDDEVLPAAWARLESELIVAGSVVDLAIAAICPPSQGAESSHVPSEDVRWGLIHALDPARKILERADHVLGSLLFFPTLQSSHLRKRDQRGWP